MLSYFASCGCFPPASYYWLGFTVGILIGVLLAFVIRRRLKVPPKAKILKTMAYAASASLVFLGSGTTKAQTLTEVDYTVAEEPCGQCLGLWGEIQTRPQDFVFFVLRVALISFLVTSLIMLLVQIIRQRTTRGAR